jgi:SAM-dependent methyltransferase
MKQEIDLLVNYPKTRRDLDERAHHRTDEHRRIARQFGKEFFDGDRNTGYGGYSYNPRFWEPVIPSFVAQYKLDKNSSILDVGCGKGFMLYDFARLIPGISVSGIDISEYAINNAKEEIREFLQVGDAQSIPFKDNTFDLVISITTVHNLGRKGCKKALREIERVSKTDKFITVDAYRTPEEKVRMDGWNLTALTYMSVDQWKVFFDEAGYTGDYYWFIP